MTTSFKYEFNWSGDGSTWVDEAAYVRQCSASLGFGSAEGGAGLVLFDLVAKPGTVALVLNNASQRFSPDYAAGALYGNLVPRREFRIRATDGTTTWPVWRGYVDSIYPEMGVDSERRCWVYCVDLVKILAGSQVGLGLQSAKRADELVKALVNLALGAAFATGTDTFGSNPADGDTFTLGTQVYRFKNTLALANDVKIGASKEITATNLKLAVNLDAGAGSLYHGSTVINPDARATVASAVLTVVARLPGTVGNAVALAKTGSAQTLSGAVLSGGTDLPGVGTNYLTCNESYSLAADRWPSDGWYVLQSIREAIESERGRFFVQVDGVPTLWDRRNAFKPLTSLFTLAAHSFFGSLKRDVDRIVNALSVRVHPRATSGSTVVVAQATSALKLDPVTPAGPSSRTVTLRFRDPTTGLPCGATSVVLPLVATTDYTVNERADGSGVNYTSDPAFVISAVELRGSEVVLTFTNAATGSLYITMLKVRGKPLTTYDPVSVIKEDAASQTLNLKRAVTVDLPLSGDDIFAVAYGEYVIDRYASAFSELVELRFENVDVISGVNVFSVQLMNVVSVTDAQTGLTAIPVYVLGYSLEITPQGFELKWRTARADDRIYWNLGVVGYGELDSNTRFAP